MRPRTTSPPAIGLSLAGILDRSERAERSRIPIHFFALHDDDAHHRFLVANRELGYDAAPTAARAVALIERGIELYLQLMANRGELPTVRARRLVDWALLFNHHESAERHRRGDLSPERLSAPDAEGLVRWITTPNTEGSKGFHGFVPPGASGPDEVPVTKEEARAAMALVQRSAQEVLAREATAKGLAAE